VSARGRNEKESLRVAAFAIDGPWTRVDLAERLLVAFVDPAKAETMADQLLAHLPRPPLGDANDLARLIAELPPVPEEPQPQRQRWRWGVPQWETTAEIAALLDVTPSELDWLADARGWNRRAGDPLRHYRPHWVGTSTGGIRLIEQPKPRLAEAQRRIMRHVIACLPVHEAAHGFRKGRSAITYATPHAAKSRVIRLDIEGFFAAVTGARVRALLRAAGFPPLVAAALTGLLTTRTPLDVLQAAPATNGDPNVRRRLLVRLAHQHLPQGAPSSPALANAMAYNLDCRLAGLAKQLGADYTRYADDLAFSGPQTLPLHRLLPGVRKIVQAEGFRVRLDKTRLTAAHQRQKLAGLVVNESPAVPRAEYDALRAVLHNCVRTGPEVQNRAGHKDFQAHLRGRIEWVAAGHPARRAKLHALYECIAW
jgi:hypothetical protein